MIIPFLTAIHDELKRRNPSFETGLPLAIIDGEGRILYKPDPERNEYAWGGISDTSENYFYIRHRDSGEIMHVNPEGGGKPFTSCSPAPVQVSNYELRLVACLRNYDPYLLEILMRKSIILANFPCITGIDKVTATPIRSEVNSMTVVEEEAGAGKRFDPNLIFVAIDFDLSMQITYF